MPNEPEVSFEWQRWAAISLLRGTPLASTIATMADEGIPEVRAASVCGHILSDPTFEAARWAMGHLHKLESVLDMRQQLNRLTNPEVEIDRRQSLTREAFLEEYYATNTPVVLEDVCDKWPARSLWSPSYLLDQVGDSEVEVMTGRDSGFEYEINLDLHRSKMSFKKYVAQVLATEWSNEFYLVANNRLLAEEVAAPLWNDFTLDDRYLQPDRTKAETFLWFGPAGTVTSLHHDTMNILFNQVAGRKQFVLISPMDTHRVSNSVGVFSDVDPLAPDRDRFPMFAEVRQLQVTLGPGDTLFVPVGWWHHVTALETSISLSCTSFVYPNTFSWQHPTVVV